MRAHHLFHFGAALLLAGASLLATSCGSTSGGSQNVYTMSEGTHEVEKVVGNETLASYLTIKNPRSKRLDDGRLMVQLELTNELSTHLRFAWAVDWFDAQGFRIADTTRHWQPVNLGGGGFTTIQMTAPTPAATTYKLQVQSPDEAN